MKKFLGAETSLFALRQYETRSSLFARQYEEHIDLLHVKCRVGSHGQCSKCQLKNSISDFINSCKRYQHETPSYDDFKGKMVFQFDVPYVVPIPNEEVRLHMRLYLI